MEGILIIIRSVTAALSASAACVMFVVFAQAGLIGTGAFDANQAFWIAIVMLVMLLWIISTVALWLINRRRTTRRPNPSGR